MKAALVAGLFYFAVVFAFGILLGIIRILLVNPVLGETFGVVLGLPAMLLISWSVSRRLINRFCVMRTMPHAFAMGGLAIVLLLSSEAVLSTLVGRSLSDHLLLYIKTPEMLGLVGQIAFAVFPAIQIHLADSRQR